MAAETTETIQARAEAKWVRCSARKARVVLEHIRGRTVPEARTVLAFTQRAAAEDIEKVLRSAVANAEVKYQDRGLSGDDLVVAAAYADEGPTLKRWRARARGRVNRINKRSCHITIVLGEAPQARSSRSATSDRSEPIATEPEASSRRKRSPKEAAA